MIDFATTVSPDTVQVVDTQYIDQLNTAADNPTRLQQLFFPDITQGEIRSASLSYKDGKIVCSEVSPGIDPNNDQLTEQLSADIGITDEDYSQGLVEVLNGIEPYHPIPINRNYYFVLQPAEEGDVPAGLNGYRINVEAMEDYSDLTVDDNSGTMLEEDIIIVSHTERDGSEQFVAAFFDTDSQRVQELEPADIAILYNTCTQYASAIELKDKAQREPCLRERIGTLIARLNQPL